jgi:hypothetical protein
MFLINTQENKHEIMNDMKKPFVLIILGLCMFCGLAGQASTFVDEKGVWRWTETKEEVSAFGVNYSVPFAHPFRAHNYLGIPHDKAIDADVYHMVRMGLDGYRIHVWDAEISDSLGNLVYNKHLQLFDYLLYKLKERDIKMFLTPMNFYTNGYPERGTTTTGFRDYYDGKRGCLTDTASFPIQQNYLIQFVNHVNPYTGIAYKDEPNIIAFEINNEPFNHGDRPDLTTEYINRMASAIRSTGSEKPIFYNVSHNIDQIDNFGAADIQGGTFQWYPTGLTAGYDQKGNMLPNVDQYPIPFDDHARFKNMAKAVYEFSPADVGASSHIYPVMARSFREAGFQFAAQFAYDPMGIAYANTDYVTHYVSLPFAPKKSMGMMLASEVFHRIPLGKSYGRYPDNTTFDEFRVSYEDDLAEMVTNEKFLYTNNTGTSPPKPAQLDQVAGTGSSPVVKYEGTGAYFLDKLEDGVWRLEVMPDAVWVKDPFERPSLKKKPSVVLWKEWPMAIQLPDLGGDFSIEGLNEGNEAEMSAKGISFPVSPGSYLLTRKGKTSDWDGGDTWKNIKLNEFYAPETNCTETHVLHESPVEITVGSKHILTASVVSPGTPDQVELVLMGGFRRGQVIPMVRTTGYEYQAEIPSTLVENPGQLSYYITINEDGNYHTYPSGIEGRSSDWDFYDRDPWQVAIVPAENQVCLFDAERDGDEVFTSGFGARLQFIPSMVSGKIMVNINVNNLNAQQHNYSIRSYFLNQVGSRLESMGSRKELVLYGHSLNDKPCKLQLILIMKDGSTYGGILTLDSKEDLYKLPLDDLEIVKRSIMPRPYPGFLPYWFEMNSSAKLDLTQVENIQISIGPGIPESEYGGSHGVAIGRIVLQ